MMDPPRTCSGVCSKFCVSNV